MKKDHASTNRPDKRRNNDRNEAKLEPFYPIPQHTADILNSSPQANFSLCFPRLVQWIDSGDSIKKTETDTNQKILGIIEQLCCIANEKMPYAQAVLDRYHKQQNAYIGALQKRKLQTLTIYAQLIAPFITGLGSGHPTETGMILDRNTGVPYLPASSIKGVLRLAYAVSIAKGRPEVPESELERYFGGSDSTEGGRGQVVFLDAYPLKVPQVKVDIMNPHFQPYYAENHAAPQSSGTAKDQIPLETNAPVPIKFLSVNDTNTVFVFRAFFLPLSREAGMANDKTFVPEASCTKEDTEALHKAFLTAFSLTGFGGKTAIGYGHFKEIIKEDAEKIRLATALPPNKAVIGGMKSVSNQAAAVVLSYNIPKNKGIYKAELLEQNKKGTWKARLCDFPLYEGSISDSGIKIQNGVKGSYVIVEATSVKQENPKGSIFKYGGEVQ